ncbi:MAG: sodium:proton antiporter [Planctomycetaceae bacterium]|nr:sodium:proton antiporter [Planctomycetaceae bacterium]MBT5885277.1 sodium:proton antiporter [Planctomycetaceae bacterium]MBT6847875.1 sodium:proton antiporter [Planctomycetaceae bacterium]MBT7254892.1 sodium:proton antiporter [Planctomycetaceae bacterium]MBT7916002.1 sodium:proton antiporter [Planctomycetaceae bacterium]
MRRPISFLFENSLFLIFGTVAALLWANLGSIDTYNHFVHFPLVGANSSDNHDSDKEGLEEQHEASTDHAADPPKSVADGVQTSKISQIFTRVVLRPDDTGHQHGITVHFLINDILMAMFFAIAAGEVWEALLPGGSLSNPRKAATPLLATLGGILGPAGLYMLASMYLDSTDIYGDGWAIPCATDIAFSYLVARMIFGGSHPAIAFLLLLAIADDAIGLLILAVFYPSKPIEPVWFLLTLSAMLLCWLFRKKKIHSFWAYLLIPGTLCWLSFDLAGIHPALGLVPIIPCLPHAHTDLGIFAREELKRHDTLNEMMHWWKNPVELILGMFGLINAGVVFGHIGQGTYLVLLGLIIGKPLGICLFTWIAKALFRLEMPAGMTARHVVVVGVISSIGFTVALFVSTAAFKDPSSQILDEVKMGAVFSFFGAILAFIVARLLRIRPLIEEQFSETTAPTNEATV